MTEDKADQDRLQSIVLRERDVSDTVRQLDKDLTQERLEHQRQVAEQKSSIMQLKQQLQSIKSKTTVDAKYFRKEAHARTCSIARTHRQSERSQEIRVQELEQRREIERSVHHATVEFFLHFLVLCPK